MKLVLIYIIGAIGFLQASGTGSNEWMGTPIFDSHSIFNLITSTEESLSAVFSNPTSWISGSLTAVINNLLNIENPLYSVISSEAKETIEKIRTVRKDVENMAETLFSKNDLLLGNMSTCLLSSTYTSKIDAIKKSTRSCIAGQYRDGVALLQSLLENFMDLIKSPKPNLPSEDDCNALQKGYFDMFGAIHRRNCYQDVQRKSMVESQRRFSYVRNAVIDIGESAQSIPEAMVECAKNGTSMINDLKQEILSNCRDKMK